MVRSGHAMARAQVVLDAREQLRSHFGIGHGAVGGAGAWQAEKIHQRAEFVAGGLWVQPA